MNELQKLIQFWLLQKKFLQTSFLIKRNIRVSYRTDSFFFFVVKMFQRQNVSTTKRLVNKTSRRQNVVFRKCENRANNVSPLYKKLLYCWVKFILATRICIEQCFYWKLYGGTNHFPIGDLPVQSFKTTLFRGRSKRKVATQEFEPPVQPQCAKHCTTELVILHRTTQLTKKLQVLLLF